MKIGFVGCGAIGSCYASYLSREHEVCVLDTYAPVIESIKKNGILVDECVPGTGTGETVVFHPAMATTDPKEIGVVDLLIVFVHYQYLEAAVRNALPMIDKHTMILCLQNGLGNYDEIAKVVPEEQIIIGNTAFGSTPVAPGHVKHTGTGVTNMGSLKAPMAKVEEMAEGLRAAGLEVQVHEVLLAVAQLLELCQFCLGGCFVRIPLDEEEILRLHAVIQPLAVCPQQVVQMIHLIAIGQAQALLGVDIFRFHLQHFDDLNGALQIFVLSDALVGELPARQECLHQQVYDRDLLFHVCFLLPRLFPLTSIR